MRRTQAGFTLIEILVAMAILGILTAIALPAYKDYVVRARLTEAFSALGGVQPLAEQYWSNNHDFTGFDRMPANSANFTYALSNASPSTYVVTATGIGTTAGFVFTINQSGQRATIGVPAGWTANASCWVDRKGGSCSQ